VSHYLLKEWRSKINLDFQMSLDTFCQIWDNWCSE